MIPTPDLSHLTRNDYDLVYEPAGAKLTHPVQIVPYILIFSPTAEDTFILLDALEKDADELRKLRPSVCLEVGWVSPSVGSRFLIEDPQLVDLGLVAYLCS